MEIRSNLAGNTLLDARPVGNPGQPALDLLTRALPPDGGFSQLLNLVLLKLIERALSERIDGVEAAPAGRPLAGRISQGFRQGHPALDIAVPIGTPVRATMPGRVIYAGWNDEGYGNLVVVENGPYRTYFAHLDRIPLKPGDWVEAGTVIGLSGNTGNSTGPHLHYEVRLNGSPISIL